MIRKVAAVLVAVATSAGCANTTAGQAVRPPASPSGLGAYVSTLPDAQRQSVEHDSMVRALDPCGYVDPGSFERIGVVTHFDAAGSQSDCEITINADGDKTRSLDVQVGVIPRDNGYLADSKTIKILGTQIAQAIPRSGAGAALQCHNLAPFDERSMLWVSVFGRTTGPACRDANTIMEGVIPHLGDRPQREGSKFKAFHAISMADPCAALSAVGQDGAFTMIEKQSGPWQCNFEIGDDTRTVVFETAVRKEFERPHNGTAFTLGGHRALRVAVAPRCSVTVELGDPEDGVTYVPIGDPTFVANSVRVSAQTCAAAEKTASAAVAAYLG